MQTYALDAYRSRELNIDMRTSSGDHIAIDLSNSQSLSQSSGRNAKGSSDSFRFSSMEAFSFSLESNGISEQDQKEIAAFMEIARPYLEAYFAELQEGGRSTPRNEVARNVAAVFDPLKGNGNAVENYAKRGIISLFDDAAKMIRNFETLFDEAQKLLEKTLDDFSRETALLYA